jgi:hypothetical protein
MALTTFRSSSAPATGMATGSRRRVARFVATTALAGALTVAAAGTASAAGTATAPPAASVAAPAVNGTPVAGDGNQNYWASDNCHYFVQGGTWWSDMCLFALADANRNRIPGLFGYFQNLGNGRTGREVLRIDLSMPGYVAFAPVTDVVGGWLRAPINDPSRIQVLGTTIDGKPQWVTYVRPPAGQSSGYDLNYDMSAKGQAIRDLQNKINQTSTDNMENTIGIKIDPYHS